MRRRRYIAPGALHEPGIKTVGSEVNASDMLWPVTVPGLKLTQRLLRMTGYDVDATDDDDDAGPLPHISPARA